MMFRLLISAWRLPRVSVDLMLAKVRAADPYYAALVAGFVRDARKRSWRHGGFGVFDIGYAVCRLPESFDDYFMSIEAAARRNVKKARRLGYRFAPIAYNEHLEAIRDIRTSTDTRQGKLPDAFLNEVLLPCPDPLPKTVTHGYPYVGVFKGERLVAFGGGLLSGEVFALEQIYGHAAFLVDGVVPLLIVELAAWLYAECPRVRFYSYGMFYGAGETLQRFKRKFGFVPQVVRWVM